MQQFQIELTEEEKLVLGYRNFEYKGMQVNLEQYVEGNREYNEEHYNRLIDTLLEKYTLLQKCLIKIMEAHGHKRIPIQSFDFYLNESTLIVYFERR
jgi:hypothetical protein